MVVQVSFTLAFTIIINYEYAIGDNLWCYECNTDLKEAHTRECNDPYIPAPHLDLIQCSQNESQHCLKSIVDYGGVLVTIRGCVPSREVDGYCQPREYFPGSNIVCSFCQDYACNDQRSIYTHVFQGTGLLLLPLGAMLFH